MILVSVYRKILKPLPLSNGVILPANCYVAVAGGIQATTAEDGSELPYRPFQWAEMRRDGYHDVNDKKLSYVFSA